MAFGKDWNILAVTYERENIYRLNANRGKGREAQRIKDNAARHQRTIYWAVFDQDGKLLEGGPGPYAAAISGAVIKQLGNELATNNTVREVLLALESGRSQRSGKILSWTGYPQKKEDRKREQAESDAKAVAAGKPRVNTPTSIDDTLTPDDTMSTIGSDDEDSVEEVELDTYKLVVEADGGEFESVLRLGQDAQGHFMGMIVAPDGTDVAIESPDIDGDSLVFNVTFNIEGQDVTLRLKGTLEGDTLHCVMA